MGKRKEKRKSPPEKRKTSLASSKHSKEIIPLREPSFTRPI